MSISPRCRFLLKVWPEPLLRAPWRRRIGPKGTMKMADHSTVCAVMAALSICGLVLALNDAMSCPRLEIMGESR